MSRKFNKADLLFLWHSKLAQIERCASSTLQGRDGSKKALLMRVLRYLTTRYGDHALWNRHPLVRRERRHSTITAPGEDSPSATIPVATLPRSPRGMRTHLETIRRANYESYREFDLLC